MQWDANAIMDICIGIFFLLFGAGLLYMLLRLAGVFGRATNILTDVNTEVIPLLTRVEATLDRVNGELDQVEEITTSMAKIVKMAETTLTAVQAVLTSPIKKVAGLSSAVSEGISSFVSGKRKET
jgi:predicted PurR-regulated permease PerM